MSATQQTAGVDAHSGWGQKEFVPTSAVVMGGLAIARVPYGRYLRWVWPLLAMLAVVTIVGLGVGALLA